MEKSSRYVSCAEGQFVAQGLDVVRQRHGRMQSIVRFDVGVSTPNGISTAEAVH